MYQGTKKHFPRPVRANAIFQNNAHNSNLGRSPDECMPISILKPLASLIKCIAAMGNSFFNVFCCLRLGWYAQFSKKFVKIADFRGSQLFEPEVVRLNV